eukprot:TRINITY_DN1157_c0_g1_i1.p1 TRINITY_DN1157_c0_g1~~TRINITY_DN1157_c0_g1_i1.p1  ORF type:complete len:141 (+),score=36.72 TRINITY_DN1157_c0_g1_i1:124-546(+)
MTTVHPDVQNAYLDVRSDKTETRWVYLHYEDKQIVVGATGDGGLSELVGHFNDNERAYGYLRVTTGDDLSARAKFVFISWVGNKVPPLQKARVSTDKAFVKEIIKDFAIEVHATEPSDLEEDSIMAAVKKAGGANYGTGH